MKKLIRKILFPFNNLLASLKGYTERNNTATSISFIGVPDEKILNTLRESTGIKIAIKERKKHVVIVFGTGLFKKRKRIIK